MQPDHAAPHASEWRQHGPVLIASVAGVVLSTVNSYTLGVMIRPLEREFGWTRAEITAGPVILAFMAVFAAPMVGAILDRVGPRRIGLFGVCFFCGAVALLSTAGPHIASWLLLWVLISVAAMFILPTIWTAAVSSLFVKNRGFALAITLCGTGVGGATLPALTNFLVEQFGWRGGYIAIAILGMTIVLPLVYFFLTSASDAVRAQRAAHKQRAATDLAGATAREGLRSWRFFKLTAASTIVSIGTGAIIGNAVPVLISHDFTPANAASIAGMIGIGAIIGRLCGGYLLDRLNPNIVAGTSVLMPALACTMLSVFPASTEIAMTSFLILGLGVGTELDACAFLAARHFGLRSFGVLFGTINGMLMIFGNMLSPFIANYVYDVTRTYDLVIWALVPTFVTAAIFFYILGHPPEAERTETTLQPVPQEA